jgi:serine/threonine protein kinase
MSEPVQWSEESLRRELAPDFEILRTLGKGVTSKVFLARESALGRPVAIKVLRPHLASDEIARTRFDREARSAAGLHHTNIAHVYRVGVVGHAIPYVVMEFIDGRTLADQIAATGPLTTSEANEALSQVAQALKAAHKGGIIHRDVRPANVLRDKDGRVVLTDFGIASVLDIGGDGVRITGTGEIIGDPRYISPEQLEGDSVTEATDIYSFGVLGYELITGQGPFGESSRMNMVAAHLRREPMMPLLQRNANADPHLAEVLHRCLARRPEHRPSAAEVARWLADPSSVPGMSSTAEAGVFVSFLSELRRRKVYQVAVAYLAGAFLILEGTDIALPSLPLPAWTLSVIVWLALAGFPLAVILAWVYDIRQGRIHRTEGPSESTLSQEALGRRRVLQIGALALSLLLVGSLLGWWFLGR